MTDQVSTMERFLARDRPNLDDWNVPRVKKISLSRSAAQLEEAWSCTLKTGWLRYLERVCQTTARARLIKRLMPGPGATAAAAKRMKRIDRVASDLLDLLVQEVMHPDQLWLLKESRETAGWPEKIVDVIYLLDELRAEVGPELVNRSGWNPRKPGRPSGDAWDIFVQQTAAVYSLVRNKKPTANWSSILGRYDSPFLRGLLILHDALPAGVRLKSTDFLGSRVADNLKRPKGPLWTHVVSDWKDMRAELKIPEQGK